MVPMARDAPGDNQFVNTSLSLEHIQTRDNPGSPFLGRLAWLIAANSQLKHGMRSWWLTCRLSSKDGRKIGSGMVAIHLLGCIGP